MKPAKNTIHQTMRWALRSGNYDLIDAAILKLEASGDLSTWGALLRDCMITNDGMLIASEALTVSGNRQAAADYGIIELIGRVPTDVATNHTLDREGIKVLRIRQHEGAAGVYTSMERFPSGVYRLLNLTALHVDSAGIPVLPEGISALKKLEKLALLKNDLKALPTDIGGCISLQILDLSYNKLTEIPENISGLSQLNTLLLRHNHLRTWPSALESLPWLEHLDLSYNNIGPAIPAEIARLPGLQTLNLSGNVGLTTLPAALATMPALRELSLERCSNLRPVPHRRTLKDDDLWQYMAKLGRSHGIRLAAPVRASKPEQPINPKPAPGAVGQTNALSTARISDFLIDRSALSVDEQRKSAIISKYEYMIAPTHELLESLLTYFQQGDLAQESAGIQLLRTLDDDQLYAALFDRWDLALLHEKDDNLWKWAFRHGVVLTKRQVLLILQHNRNEFLNTRFDLSSMTRLELEGREAYIPGIFQCFPQVKDLRLSLHLTMLPPDLSVLQQLESLYVYACKQKRPLTLEDFPALRSLNFRHSQIITLEVNKCEALTEFKYEHGSSDHIKLKGCRQLESVNIGISSLKTLEIGAARQFRRLHLNGASAIRSLKLPALTALRELHLGFHTDEKLLAEAFSSPNLEVIHINNPKDWSGYHRQKNPPIPLPTPTSKQLVHVGLNNIGLQDVPAWLFELNRLKYLSLAGNKISALPTDLSGLNQLEALHLEDNFLPSLPQGIHFPGTLTTINLSDNQLTKVPIELADLANLGRLTLGIQTHKNLAHTTLNEIPAEISLKPGLQLEVLLRKQDKRRMRARNAAYLLHQGLPWEEELTRKWGKDREV
jgi:Leucine-rich repeat (LRR) protein